MVFVLVWFQPQKLFIDERVNDTVPVAASPAAPTTDAGSAATAAPPAPAVPVDVAGGTFVSLDHGTNGTVRILELADGARVVRLEDLDTDNGPDLYLYLSTNPAGGEESAFDDDHVNLGRLQGNLGNQNYDLPEDWWRTRLPQRAEDGAGAPGMAWLATVGVSPCEGLSPNIVRSVRPGT